MRYKLIISLIIILFNNNLYCQNKKDHARFNILTREYVINKDGSIDYTYHKELKLLSKRSFNNDYGETFIIYNPKYQTIKINKSYTVRADGSKVNTPENAFNEGLPFACTDCERYNGLREKIITHTALELNSTIVLDYTIHTKPEYIKDFMEIIEIAEYCPVTKYTITVKVPSDINLKNRMLNLRLGPNIKTDNNGNKIYTWEINNVSQTSSEAYLPKRFNLYPTLILSTCKDMQKAYFEFVNQDALRNYSIPQCKDVINSLTSKTDNQLDKILAIRDYVVDAIHYNNFSPKYNNYNISPASITWNSACGNEVDKAILLTAILREAGFEAYPVCICEESLYSDNVACLETIAHYIVRVNYDDKYVYISPIEKNKCSLDYIYSNYMMFVLDANVDHLSTTMIKPINNEVDMKGSLKIEKDGNIQGNIECYISSKNIPTFKMLKDDDEINSLIKNLKGTAKSINNNDNTIKYTFNATQLTLNETNNTGYNYFELPVAQNTYNIDPAYLNESRENTVRCYKTKENYSYNITFPEECRIITPSYKKIIEKPFGKIIISIEANGNNLNVTRSLTISQELIQLSQYKDFRDMMILWNNINYRRMIIKF